MRKLPVVLLLVALVAFIGCDSNDDNGSLLNGTWTGSASQDVQSDISLDLDAELQLETEGESVGGIGNVVALITQQDGDITIKEETDFSSFVSGSRNGQSVSLDVVAGDDSFGFEGEIAEDATITGTATFTSGSDSYGTPFTIRKERDD